MAVTPLRPLLLYDGDCGFCAAAVRRVRSPRTGRPDTVAWQSLPSSSLAAFGLSAADVQQAAQWVDRGGRPWAGHLAIGWALVAAGGWRAHAGRAVLHPPGSWLARPAYGVVARHRHRLGPPGAACTVNRPAPTGGATRSTRRGEPSG